jgi:hypothetical protein
MAKEFECERDGVVIRGEDDEDLVANVERHLAVAHPDLARKVFREDIVAAATDGLTLRLRRVLLRPPGSGRPRDVCDAVAAGAGCAHRAGSHRGSVRQGAAPCAARERMDRKLRPARAGARGFGGDV